MPPMRLADVACRQYGFSLLEVLLGIAILSAVAYMTLAVVDNNASQVRHDDTRARLQAFRTAILGADPGTTLSGYVADNGRLPEAVTDMISTPAGFDAFGVVTPQFDPVPDSTTGMNNGPLSGIGAEIELNDPRQTLVKGHRGIYLPLSTAGRFRDGWGTDRSATGASGIDCPTDPGAPGGNEGSDLDADNQGWCLTLSGGGFYIDSYGLDGAPGAATGDPYEQDQPMPVPVLATDWQVSLQAGTTVRIVNRSGADIDLAASGANNLRASLLVYRNDADAANEFNWRRISTGTALDVCLDGDGDGQCGGSPAPSETTAAFTSASLVPVAEHLLVLVADPDGVLHTVDDTTVLPAGVGTQGFAARRVRFHYRQGAPEMELVIH